MDGSVPRWPCRLFPALIALLGVACQPAAGVQAVDTIRIATGDPDGVYLLLGNALAHAYKKDVPSARVSTVASGGLSASLDEIERRSADLTFTTADAAYAAHTEGSSLAPRRHAGIRAIAMLYPNAVQLVVRRDSPIRRIADFSNARVGLGTPPGGQPEAAGRSRMADLLVSASGSSPAGLSFTRGSFSEIAAGLKRGTIDVGWILAGYPVAPIAALAATTGIRLLAVDRHTSAKLRVGAPFYKPVVIPAGTYAGQTHSVATVGVENLLVCRDDLEEELVYRLTKAFFAALPAFAAVHPAARQVNAALAPATPVPLHRGAARYYRERELFR
jgi:TRAP transporter TAXI family solute receptor